MTSSIAGGNHGASSVARGGGWNTWAIMTALIPVRWPYGVRPVNSRNSEHPSEYRSPRASTRWPSMASGAAYDAVATSDPVAVNPVASSRARAIPKSANNTRSWSPG
ncbi:hypothetical protein C1Y40_00093 [Mycobacterium talmoniae]|uniref:Uncharacterized protein n=1 Tax=Mycobacterium talmoniae TaxID=1858794 RepID=A0A2S8BSP9_9MYCO|nr:hypothetical protein C1Y40_00093 [Mycobacterium talmoniae]